MNERVSQEPPAAIVARLREMIREGKSDQWIGMQARLLIEPGSTWVDDGSGPGHDEPGQH